MTRTTELPGFTLFLPDEFFALPRGELDLPALQELGRAVATRFGLDPDAGFDEGLAETTVMLATVAGATEAGGSSYTAAGFFRSPDDATRPIMALISCFALESDHRRTDIAIAGLEQTHRSLANGGVEIVELPAGPAVIAQNVAPREIAVGEDTVTLTECSITAWLPGPGSVLGIAVTSNNAEDWGHVVDLARGIFETFEWSSAQEGA